MRARLLTLSLLGSVYQFSDSFRPPLARYAKRANHNTRLFSADTSSSPGEVVDRETAALISLAKLLARQQAEVKETERLMKMIDDNNFNAHQEGDDPSATEEQDIGSSMSTATSFLSGVDYRFISRSEGPTSELKSGFVSLRGYDGVEGHGGPPANIFVLGSQQFIRNWNAMKGEYLDEGDVDLTPQQVELQQKLKRLTLNSTAIWERETEHGPIVAPLVIKIPYLAVCYLLDVVFEGKYVPSRFFLLETVARMPYFSYIGMLHFFETLGFWRRSANTKRIHFAEEMNEYNHLLIMESLGGDQSWWIRFTAQHSAIVYFIVLCVLWALSPTLSYRFSELLETHAVSTYGVFLEENEELLKELPPSLAAVEYYSLVSSDPMYTEFQIAAISNDQEIRRPGESMNSMHAVFTAILADESDHVSTMQACLDPDASLNSPAVEKRVLTGIALVAMAGLVLSSGSDPTGLLVDGNVDIDMDLASDVAAAFDGSALMGLVEGAVAAAAGVAQQIITDGEEGNLLELGEGLLEVGAEIGLLEISRRALVKAVNVTAEILPTWF